ncbi:MULTISPECIES: hypothetical protein [Streptomyces]|nr:MULTISPECIES: hypothetical protein [Streptomyces]QEV11934.1 hypothetical protein CP974_07780 [Streptomyces fradiae ATCC 10745 = DSM 40063]UQS28438.1 hypothetical protein J5J01_15210 [Streptomyces fradiae]
MGDTGRARPPHRQEQSPMPRLALYSLAVCLLATAAAVVSFVRGPWWLGVVWVLLAGVSSNMSLYYRRRSRPVSE